MNADQKDAILAYYNALRDRLPDVEERMDSKNPRVSARAANEFTRIISKQEAVDDVLDLLGYTLFVNDEEYAIGIEPKSD